MVDELRHGPNVEIQTMDPGSGWSGLYWRFLPVSDPAVDVAIIRDTDSRLSSRERSAVNDWLETAIPFHIMRDHPHHRLPMPGGMWGCRDTSILKIRELGDDWTANHARPEWGDDQRFLAEVVYPIARRAGIYVHDDLCFGRPFPDSRLGLEHVGQRFTSADTPYRDDLLSIERALRRPLFTRLLCWVSRLRQRW